MLYFSSNKLRINYCYYLPSIVVVHLSVVVRLPSTPLTDFSEIPGPIFKLHVNLSVKGGLKIYPNGQCLLIKTAAMSIYSKTKHLEIFFFRAKKAFGLNLSLQHWKRFKLKKVYKVCLNDVLGWPLTFLRHGKICILILYIGKMLKSHFLKMY